MDRSVDTFADEETRVRSKSVRASGHVDLTPNDVAMALCGARRERLALMATIEPVVSARVNRWLRDRGALRHQSAWMEESDLRQDIYERLFERDGKLLRSWNPEKGLSLRNWVGLMTRQVLVRRHLHARKSPQTLSASDALDSTPCPTEPLEERDELRRLLYALEARVSSRMLLILAGTCLMEDTTALAVRAGMSEQAVYAARRRITLLAREMLGDPDRQGD